MKKLLFFVLLGVCASSTFAADWKKLSETESRSDFLDRSSVSRKGVHVRSWSKVKFRAPQELKGRVSEGTHYSSALQFADFDCDARELYLVSVIYYAGTDVNGRLLHSEKAARGEVPSFTPVAPGTVGETWMKNACNKPNKNRKTRDGKKIRK